MSCNFSIILNKNLHSALLPAFSCSNGEPYYENYFRMLRLVIIDVVNTYFETQSFLTFRRKVLFIWSLYFMSEAIDRLDAVFAHNIHFLNGSWASKLALGNKSEYFARQKQNKNQARS